MKAARAPRDDKTNVRLLVIDRNVHSGSIEMQDSSMERLADHLQPGEVVVVNDAATLPASLHGRDLDDNQVEIRLTTQLDETIWQAVVFGAGDWQTPTEARPLPPRFRAGEEITIAPEFRARVRSADRSSKRLIELEFNLSGEEMWRGLYRYGKPVQYSYLNDELKLWSIQNVYSGRPWAVEMPSAGHALNWRVLLQLIRKGIEIIPLSLGAGLSSTGDPALDRTLPLAERYEIPLPTMEAVRRARTGGGRVIAVGTSVVRALETSGGGLSGFTDLKIGPGHQRQIVDGILTGTHDVSESHYRLLEAFLPAETLVRMSEHLEAEQYLTHEFGDLCLLLAPIRF